jgi:hypothetical protein
MTSGGFNPLDMESLADSIVRRLLVDEPTPLKGVKRFDGAGIYAIYYIGDFPAYRIVRDHNIHGRWALPIYIGKATRSGGRRGVDAPKPQTNALSARLADHAASIRAVANLELDDFYARWLVIDDIWVALGESTLLRSQRPVWNAMVDGFGNHDPGVRRRTGLRPMWDTLHPGRPWAAGLADRPSGSDAAKIAADAAQYLQSRHGGLAP